MKTQTTALTIRPARRDDAAAIRALAALEDAPVPGGELVVAEVDGEVVAVHGAGTGQTLADPYSPAAHLIALFGDGRSGAAVPRAPLGERIRQRLLVWERLWANARPGEAV
jgi:hypothetical protein